MNYIELIRGFWRSHEEHLFTPTEIAVYFYLVEVCNICQWKNPFKRNNAKIGADLSISFNTLKNARNKLQQVGLMSFKTTNGNSNVTYTLSNFDKVTNEVYNEVDCKVTNEVYNEVLPTKDKLNINKTSNNISTNVDSENPPDLSPDKPPKKETINYNEVVSMYHKICPSFPKVQKLTDERKNKIRIRVNELKKQFPEWSYLKVLEALFKKIEKSDFMRGNNERQWIASFDWVFENGKNWVKIYEGIYDNRQTKNGNEQSHVYD